MQAPLLRQMESKTNASKEQKVLKKVLDGEKKVWYDNQASLRKRCDKIKYQKACFQKSSKST